METSATPTASECSIGFIAYTYVFCFSGLLMVPIAIWCLLNQIKTKLKSHTMNNLTLLFYVVTILCSLSTPQLVVVWCQIDLIKITHILQHIFVSLWALQWQLLVVILFARLYYTFLGSVHALKKCTLVSFCIIYGLYLFFVILAFILLIFRLYILFIFMFIIVCLFAITLSLALSILFVYKLYEVNKNAKGMTTKHTELSKSKSSSSVTNSNSNVEGKKEKKKDFTDFTEIITKLTILTIISLSTIFNVIITVPLFIDFRKKTGMSAVIWTGSIMINFITNFICIMLTMNYSKKYYQCICGCFDKWCRSIFLKLNRSTNKPQNELVSYIENNKTSK
eukprot:301781_1